MTGLPKISIRVEGGMTPSACVALARAADEAGLPGVWFAENAFARGILPAAAACAAATQTLRINAGVFNPYSRHPTMMAMEIGALDELSGGRASIGIGAGIAAATDKMGLDSKKPLQAMRDCLAILRPLLSGQEVDYAGASFSARKVKLDYRPRADIPIYLAGRGDLMVKLSGEAADGLLLSNMCALGFAQRLAGLMRSARAAAGRPGAGEVVQYMPAAVGRDRDVALRAAKHAVGEMLPRFWALAQKLDQAKQALLTGTGIGEETYARASRRLRAGEDAAQVVDEDFVLAFAIAGTPDECLEQARRYHAAGVTELAMTFAGPDAAGQVALIGDALKRSR
jgi:5,10-methylenetetrahydromethanopterin reductase